MVKLWHHVSNRAPADRSTEMVLNIFGSTAVSACATAKKLPPPGWTQVGESIDSVFSPTTRELGDSTFLWQASPSSFTHSLEGLGAVHSIGNPIHVYPLYENGLRAHVGQTIEENNRESARLYAEFAKVAKRNPYAWNFGRSAETEETIGTVTKRNRMICFPCKEHRHDQQYPLLAPLLISPLDPLLMNAFNTVNLAAACILTTTDCAQELGIPRSRWIYPLGGAGTQDSNDCSSVEWSILVQCCTDETSLGTTQLSFQPGRFKILGRCSRRVRSC